MKNRKDDLNTNISRLVKLTDDSTQPSKAFTDSLTDRALKQLHQNAKDQPREERKITMKPRKLRFPRILAYAAVIGIACGLLFSITMPNLKKAEQVSIENTLSEPFVTRQNMVALTPPPPPPQTTELVVAANEFKDRIVVSPDTSQFVQLPTKLPKPVYKGTPVPKLSKAKSPPALYTETPIRLGVARMESVNSVAKAPAYPAIPNLHPTFKRERRVDNIYGMAHGGNTPPNGEDVDAMFFENYGVNPFIDTEDDHLSTFATDVDTGSYTVCRSYLMDGNLPPNEAVRVEEFVNYFDYGYPAPEETVFSVIAEAAPWQFGSGRHNSYLLRLGLKARQVSSENRKPAILTFVIDVSGSMNRENRLELVKKSLRILVGQLTPRDRIGIAVYGSQGKKIMGHKGLKEKNRILEAIDSLRPEGSTNAEEGIRIGYKMASQAFVGGNINRVILCSDGVANVGKTGPDDIFEMIKAKTKKGITLSALGFGMSNYNDVLMEQLGDKGNGHYAYVDTIAEARRMFTENLTGTLQVVALDVKVQVDFNPEVVRSYRLIGYENRDVPDEKFRDNKQDGGEMGAGHSVTAMYEIKLWEDAAGDIAATSVRYKDPDTKEVDEFSYTVSTSDLAADFAETSDDFILAATVTEFAEILRKSHWAKGASLDSVLRQARKIGPKFDSDSKVIELMDLIAKAKDMTKRSANDDSHTGEHTDDFKQP